MSWPVSIFLSVVVVCIFATTCVSIWSKRETVREMKSPFGPSRTRTGLPENSE